MSIKNHTDKSFTLFSW